VWIEQAATKQHPVVTILEAVQDVFRCPFKPTLAGTAWSIVHFINSLPRAFINVLGIAVATKRPEIDQHVCKFFCAERGPWAVWVIPTVQNTVYYFFLIKHVVQSS